MKSHFSVKQGVLASHSQLGWIASSSCQKQNGQTVVIQLSWPYFLSNSDLVVLTLQLPACSHTCAWFLRVASRESIASCLFDAHFLINSSHSLTYKPLHNSHLNTRFLNAELQANLVWNKANTWLNKFDLTLINFHFISY